MLGQQFGTNKYKQFKLRKRMGQILVKGYVATKEQKQLFYAERSFLLQIIRSAYKNCEIA